MKLSGFSNQSNTCKTRLTTCVLHFHFHFNNHLFARFQITCPNTLLFSEVVLYVNIEMLSAFNFNYFDNILLSYLC